MNLRIPLIAVALGAAFAASAQTVTVTTETGETEMVATTESAQDAKKAAASRTCLRSTGSRIVAAQNLRAERDGKKDESKKDTPRCAVAAGRVYSNEDLERSGYVDIADALRHLDTSIR